MQGLKSIYSIKGALALGSQHRQTHLENMCFENMCFELKFAEVYLRGHNDHWFRLRMSSPRSLYISQNTITQFRNQETFIFSNNVRFKHMTRQTEINWPDSKALKAIGQKQREYKECAFQLEYHRWAEKQHRFEKSRNHVFYVETPNYRPFQ